MLVDREERNAEATLAMIREEGGDASIFVGDVTSDDDMRQMAEAARSRYGNVNVLVNNVAIIGPGSVTDVDVDFWDTVLAVNLKSVMLCSRYAIPQMIEAGGGSIVNISSIIAFRAGGGRPTHPYAASKRGMIGLSNSMAVHYGRDNVRVNCIAPGQIHTPMASREVTPEFADLRRLSGPLGVEGNVVGCRLRCIVPGLRRVPLGFRRYAAGGLGDPRHNSPVNVPPPAGPGVRRRRRAN